MARGNRSIWIFGLAVLAVIVLAVLLMVSSTSGGRRWYMQTMAQSLVGMSEDLAYIKLGLPERTLTPDQFEAAKSAYQPALTRAARGKVLVYEEGEQAVLLFIDEDRRIEATIAVRQSSRPGASPSAESAR